MLEQPQRALRSRGTLGFMNRRQNEVSARIFCGQINFLLSITDGITIVFFFHSARRIWISLSIPVATCKAYAF